jgi:hypothetical protein
MVEQCFRKAKVAGSNPAWGSIFALEALVVMCQPCILANPVRLRARAPHSMKLCTHCKTRKADKGCRRCVGCKHLPHPKTILCPSQSKCHKSLRRWMLENKKHECCMCHNVRWFDLPIPLEVDHIDGHSENNSPDNLRLICPNCHSTTPTFKAKNKGNGRRNRRL